jgi:hypothetical protein
MMKSSAAHKAMTCAEEKVGVIRRKSGKGVEGETVHSNGENPSILSFIPEIPLRTYRFQSIIRKRKR